MGETTQCTTWVLSPAAIKLTDDDIISGAWAAARVTASCISPARQLRGNSICRGLKQKVTGSQRARGGDLFYIPPESRSTAPLADGSGILTSAIVVSASEIFLLTNARHTLKGVAKLLLFACTAPFWPKTSKLLATLRRHYTTIYRHTGSAVNRLPRKSSPTKRRGRLQRSERWGSVAATSHPVPPSLQRTPTLLIPFGHLRRPLSSTVPFDMVPVSNRTSP